MMTLGGLVEMEKQEADIVEDIRKISVNVLGDSIATWQWNDWQEKLKKGEVTDPVPAWCAAWMAHMILIANPDFDFSAIDYAVEGKPGERAEETKNRRIDELDKQIADIKEQQLELQDRFEREGGTNRNLVQRESLNNQLVNLEQQRQNLKGFDEFTIDDTIGTRMLPEVTITPKKKLKKPQ